MSDPLDKAEREARKRDLEIQEKRDAEELEKRRKNNNFTQVYPKYWKQMMQIIPENPRAAVLYNFLAEHAAPDTGAVVVAQEILAEKLAVTRMTISRYIKYLEDKNMILKIRLSGGVCAYALDPDMVWKSYSTNKDYATFKTKTLVKKIDMEKNDIHRKLNVMMKQQKSIEEIDDNQIDIEEYINKMEEQIKSSSIEE